MILDDGDLDCNYTSDFISSTSETYQSTLYTTTPSYDIEDASSTDVTEIYTEEVPNIYTQTTTEITDTTSIEYESSETTTSFSTLEVTTNISETLTSKFDYTSPSINYWTMDFSTDVSGTSEQESTKMTQLETTTTSTSITTSNTYSTESTSISTTEQIFSPTVPDTTLSNSFFTEYPSVSTTNATASTIDDRKSTVPLETTPSYSLPTTGESSDSPPTIDHKPEFPVCLNHTCLNGGTCVSAPEGPKVLYLIINIFCDRVEFRPVRKYRVF